MPAAEVRAAARRSRASHCRRRTLSAAVFGGSLTSATYGDFGIPKEVPGADKIVFGQVETADGFRLMAYDIPGQDSTNIAETAGVTRRENGATITDRTFFQSLRGQTLEEIARLWDGLADGAQIIEPLAQSGGAPALAYSPTASA